MAQIGTLRQCFDGEMQHIQACKNCLTCNLEPIYSSLRNPTRVTTLSVFRLLVTLLLLDRRTDYREQQDPSEVMLKMVRIMKTEYQVRNRKPNGTLTPIDSMFYGKFESCIKCIKCDAMTTSVEYMSQLPITCDSQLLQLGVHKFFSNEIIDNFKCDKCSNTNATSKQYKLTEPPAVLVLLLNRFPHYDQPKKSTYVSLPSHLDLTEYMQQPNGPIIYSFASAIVHNGFDHNSGHYMTLVKERETLKVLNDHEISIPSTQQLTIIKCNTYMLMYVRHTN